VILTHGKTAEIASLLSRDTSLILYYTNSSYEFFMYSKGKSLKTLKKLINELVSTVYFQTDTFTLEVMRLILLISAPLKVCYIQLRLYTEIIHCSLTSPEKILIAPAEHTAHLYKDHELNHVMSYSH